MNKTILGAVTALAVLAGSALAIQFANAAFVKENVIAQRLEGRWMLDSDITNRLDPDPGFTAPRSLEFRQDDKVLARLLEAFPRYKNETIYLAGTASISGVDHWFVVMNQSGNSHLVLFTPTRAAPMAEPHHVFINMVCSRNQSRDLLFLGGDMPRESAAAYGRVTR